MRDAVGMAFLITGLGPILIGTLHSAFRRHAMALAWTSVGTALHLVGVVIRDDLFHAVLDAGALAWCLWLWWNDGGGDGTRRRLRHWVRTFQGTRRTAPAGGTA